MLEERLLRILIRQIIQEQGVKLRTAKGYGASHPVVSRKPLTGYGDMYQFGEEPKKKSKKKKKKVKVSKAFEEDSLENIAEYERVIKEILNGE
jgi:hypothetical protein